MTTWAWITVIISLLIGVGPMIAGVGRGEPSAPPVPDTIITVGSPQGPAVTTTPGTVPYTGAPTLTGVPVTNYVYAPPSSPEPGEDDEEVGPVPTGQSSGSLVFGALAFMAGMLFTGKGGRREEQVSPEATPANFTVDRGDL